MRFGPALNDYRGSDSDVDTERYWRDAEAARAASQRAECARADRYLSGRPRLRLGADVTPATIGSRAFFGGTLREINAGALIHYDDINREIPTGVFDQDIVAQLAFNVWVAVPAAGRHDHGVAAPPLGARRRTAPPGIRLPPDVVGHCQHVCVTPQRGDALLFNPTTFHAVEPARNGRRIAFFLGLTTTGQFIAWS
ncbi:hypothetical protein ACWDG1_41070 [Streptomyces sp. NPDC001177]